MIRIDGTIGDHPNTAAEIAAALAGQGDVTLVVNSGGGDAFEGAAILAELHSHPGKVTVQIRGIAASAASLVAMGGAEIVIDPAAVFMIHDPASLAFGTADGLRKDADILDKLTATYAAAYAARSANRLADVRQWMADETWLDAVECVALGFADRIADPAGPMMVAAFDPTKFTKTPGALMRLAATGWATASPVNA